MRQTILLTESDNTSNPFLGLYYLFIIVVNDIFETLKLGQQHKSDLGRN